MRKYVSFFFVLVYVSIAFSQQILIPVQTRQTYDINPATIGINENVSFLSRKNFSGFPGAPHLYMVSINKLADEKMGIGVQMYSLEQGLNVNRGVKAAYAFRVYFTETSFLSFGLELDCFQSIFKKADYFVKHPSDPALDEQREEQVALDAGAGLSLNTNTFYLDIAVHQIPGRPVAFLNDFASNTRVRHYIASLGFKINATEKLQIIPHGLFTTTDNFIYRSDAGLKFMWDKTLWLGSMYRTSEALTVFGGYQLNRIAVHLAWDHGLSPLSAYNTGSWEVFITYNLIHSSPKIAE